MLSSKNHIQRLNPYSLYRASPWTVLLWTLLLISCSRLANGQGFRDDFSDNNLSQNPTWTGNRTDFDVSGGWLNLNARQPSRVWISTPAPVQDSAVWTFALWTALSPSQANYTRIVLASDTADLSAAYTGWHIQVGQAGSQDGLDLYRIRQGQRTLVYSFGPGLFANPFLIDSIRIVRRTTGVWQAGARIPARGWVDFGTVQDLAPLSGRYFGIEAECTSSFQSFYWHWDRIQVVPGGSITSPQQLASATCAGKRLYVLPPLKAKPGPSASALADGQPLNLIFAPQPDGRYLARLPDPVGTLGPDSSRRFLLQLTGWQDSLGLGIAPQSFACRCLPEATRLELTELKAGQGGPSGQPVLPEFLELHNPADHAVWLEDLSVRDASFTLRSFPADSLGANAYRIYTNPAQAAAFRSLGVEDVTGTPLPSLNDDGDFIQLSLQGRGVDSLAYTPAFWARTADITALSLERGPVCLPHGGWYPSRAQLGATPGRAPNYDWSQDTSLAPRLVGVTMEGSDLRLHLKPAPAYGATLSSAGLSSDPPLPGGYLSWQDSSLYYKGAPRLDSTQSYRLQLTGIPGCGGSALPSTLVFSQPVPADSGRVVLNELLYDPLPGGQAFVELYNPGNRWVSLAGLGIASLRNPWADTAWIAADVPPLEPHGYRWLAREARYVTQAYPKAVAAAYLPLRLPPFDNDGGRLLLLKPDGTHIDALAYGPDLHTPGIAKTEGVSLERVSASLATDAAGNWQSCAAQPAATPGYRNSQTLPPGLNPGGGLVADPEAFSPDADGYQDVTALSAGDLPAGTVGRLSVYDPAGNLIRRLSPQAATGPALLAVWDGRTDDGAKAGAGIYVVLAEFFHPSRTLPPRKTVVGIKP